MLTWKRIFDKGDIAYTDRLNTLGGLFPTPVEGDHIYEDVASGLTLDIDGVNPTTFASHYIRFGDQNANTLVGDDLEDRLYGMAGNDTLEGQGGNDYLEGGQGNDLLDGGLGNDTYRIGLGADTVIDSDHQGGVYWGNDLLTGGAMVDTGRWVSTDGKYSYDLADSGTDLIVSRRDGTGSATIKDFLSSQPTNAEKPAVNPKNRPKTLSTVAVAANAPRIQQVA